MFSAKRDIEVDTVIFQYGETEIQYLKSRDARLAEAIDHIGVIRRPADPDLFHSVVSSIVGQQISTAAQVTITNRLLATYGALTVETIAPATQEELQSHGISFRKAAYIQEFAQKVAGGQLDLEGLQHKTDAEVIAELSALRGIGVWTAEMILTFCLQRPDVFSYGDLAIHRGLRMLYHHRHVDQKLFEKYRRRYSPCGSVASLYLWAIAGGAVPGMKDYAPKKQGK